LENDGHGFFEKRIFEIRGDFTPGPGVFAVNVNVLRFPENPYHVLDESDDPAFVDPGSLKADGFRVTGGQEEHISFSKELFRSRKVDDCP
jgi:hypothetical protein